MEPRRKNIGHSVTTSSLADLLERILDKGIVIVGDIKVRLVDVELLTIQVRLLIASVDKAQEMGMDWWLQNPDYTSKAKAQKDQGLEFDKLKDRIAELEQKVVAGEAR
jgi:hypothetical protein